MKRDQSDPLSPEYIRNTHRLRMLLIVLIGVVALLHIFGPA